MAFGATFAKEVLRDVIPRRDTQSKADEEDDLSAATKSAPASQYDTPSSDGEACRSGEGTGESPSPSARNTGGGAPLGARLSAVFTKGLTRLNKGFWDKLWRKLGAISATALLAYYTWAFIRWVVTALFRPVRLAAAFIARVYSARWLSKRWRDMAALRAVLKKQPDGSYGAREYVLVTSAYWALMLTDGAIRMLVLFFFLSLGFSPIAIAFLFLFYEIFGVVTNLVGGWLGAKLGLRFTLFAGLAFQIVALAMMTVVTPGWSLAIAVPFVMFAQALAGIAKDLTKMSSKSSLKLILPERADNELYKWVAVLTGSKNALKGLGFFLGGALLLVFGFNLAMLLMAIGLAATLAVSVKALPNDFGKAKSKVKFTSMFSMSRRINILSAARFFLFGSRDVWFVVALPIYMASVMGWTPMGVGAFLALWVIGYGYIQAQAPKYIRSEKGSVPKAYTAQFWTFLLATIPAGIALGLSAGIAPGLVLLGGLALFAAVFAATSAVHSYLIVAYSEADHVSMNVGFYYMANAGGRLVGTVLSGWIFQSLGMIGCLWLSALFLLAAGTVTMGLTLPERGTTQLCQDEKEQLKLTADDAVPMPA